MCGAVAAVVAAAACGSDDAGSTGDEGNVDDLEIWVFSSSAPPVIEDDFATAFPQYDVEIVEIPIADVTQRLVVALQGGDDLPDVVQLPLRESGGLFSTGQFLDLSEELGPMEDDFAEGILVGGNGEINSFTMGPGNMGLWVNQAALAEHGLAVPENPTWDDVVAIARDLDAASGGTQYLFVQPPGTNGANMFNAFFNSRGGTWWNEDGELSVDEDLATETLEFMVDLDQEGLVYHGVWTDATYWDAIRSEEIVGWTMNFGVGSTSLQENVPEQSGQWRLVTWPTWSEGDEQRTGVFGGSLYAGLDGADNPQGARDFIMWWLEPEGLQAQSDTLGLVSYQPAAEEIDLDIEDPYFGGQNVRQELASVPYPEFHFFHWPETEAAITAAVDQAYAGDLTPDEAVAQIVAELSGL
ncbi:ABC transporter substrate-binding protein [Jiangella endophytica]|uniref:ABC transporter substrate-binding protein n=1 Tax=Jiangella endophytica TaxID=1623398 RepID=UPI00130039AC|nr:extracellular solute-binding protein [Jiangella endophytica]